MPSLAFFLFPTQHLYYYYTGISCCLNVIIVSLPFLVPVFLLLFTLHQYTNTTDIVYSQRYTTCPVLLLVLHSLL